MKWYDNSVFGAIALLGMAITAILGIIGSALGGW